ncbi:tetratricopeptide repeat protein [Pendulispora albinea]|uniref:Superkiller protein 3 n=1 Tax=Pendulispora albinea TaxID=2741071 RepID=A0ABZ2LIS5_9BACT
MSNNISLPPDRGPSAAAGSPESPKGGEVVKYLRAEVAATEDRARQARLLGEIGDLLERAGDEPGAARDYLAAFNADPMFREPLEALVRLMERRRSLKNLGRVIDALVRASVTPEEKTRALIMRAAFLEDVAGDLKGTKEALREATELAAADVESVGAWLALELVAAKGGDPEARRQALSERAHRPSDPTWQGLLLIDLAKMLAEAREHTAALAALEEARARGAGATYLAAVAAERLARGESGQSILGTAEEAKARAEAYASALDAQAELMVTAMNDPARGDVLGVPHGVRTLAHVTDACLRAAEVRRHLGNLAGAAKSLDRALSLTEWGEEVGAKSESSVLSSHKADPRAENEHAGNAGAHLPLLAGARVRVAEQMGDMELASRLSQKLLGIETEGTIKASLAMRLAERAVEVRDRRGALESLSKAVSHDAVCLPARALQLDLLADSGDPAAFASQLEAFADCLPTEAARARAFVLAAYVWGVQADDAAAAKAALAEARMLGTSDDIVWRVARMIALVRGDAQWAEDVTRRMMVGGGEGSTSPAQARGERERKSDAAPNDLELSHLWLGSVRNKLVRGDEEGIRKALSELADTGDGAWLAHLLQAFLPPPADVAKGANGANGAPSSETQRQSLEKLADLEHKARLSRGLSLLAAWRAHDAGDRAAARVRLRGLTGKDPSDPLVATYLADLEREDGAYAKAAAALTACAMTTDDDELSAALHLEAGLSRWRAGEKEAALDAFEHAGQKAPIAARALLAWAARGMAGESIERRRRAIRFAKPVNEDTAILELEHFATEVFAGDHEEAQKALARFEDSSDGDLALAAALARLAWQDSAATRERVEQAIARIAPAGPMANQLAAAEQLRRVRGVDPEAATQAAQRWFDTGGGLAAAFEWLTAAIGSRSPERESDARRAIARTMRGEEREAMLASAAVLDALKGRADKTPFLVGHSPAARLANLEIAIPGSDPRRRAQALQGLGTVLGEETRLDASALSGWSLLVAGDHKGARAAFETALAAHPSDLASWEGLRTAAEVLGDRATHARAAMELGTRANDDVRGAAFLEEAGGLWRELGDDASAEQAFDLAFERDASRSYSFDKIFRAVRARKDTDKLLLLISRRVEISEDPDELSKLFWEQARVLREKGDIDGAFKALESVTMFEPEHVGALALTGEIFIRRGMYDEAAESLAKLATIHGAPAKNRVTAGIAAVDLYENKLDRFDKALAVLVNLHAAGLSTLPVRERLARAAARTGAWHEATAILHELMHERLEPQGRIAAARLAMAIHRDRLGNPQGAAPAIAKLLEESPADGEAIDLLLKIEMEPEVKRRLFLRVKDALVMALRENPVDSTTVRRLARVARGAADTEIEHVALSTAQLVIGTDGSDEAVLQAFIQRKARVPQMAIDAGLRSSIVAPGDAGPMAEFFQLMAPTLAEALGPSLSALGLSKRDKVDPRGGATLRNEVAAWAGAFGIDAFDLYVGGRDPLGVYGIPGEVPALVVGAGISSPLIPPLRARVASELYAMARGSTIVRSRDATSVAAILVAACHLADVPVEAPPYAVLPEIEKSIGKVIARKTRRILPDVCRAVLQSGQDARTWYMRAHLTLARCALIASADVSFVICDAIGEPPERVRVVLKNEDYAVELLRFGFSPTYLEVRRALGLEGLS